MAQMVYAVKGTESEVIDQIRYLQKKGVKIEVLENTAHFASPRDYQNALKLLWNGKFTGWWHYDLALVAFSICSEEQFKEAYEIACQPTTSP